MHARVWTTTTSSNIVKPNPCSTDETGPYAEKKGTSKHTWRRREKDVFLVPSFRKEI